jgi:signal peptide peptidase SppA
MNNQIWIGTENSLNSYMALNDIYLNKEAKTLSKGDEGEPSYLLERLGEGVAAININGTLVPNKEWWHEYEKSHVTSYEEILNAIDEIKYDDNVKSVIVSINSSGGNASGISDVADSLKSLSKAKKNKVLTYVNSTALSAGYWLAASTPKIVANKMAELGSIGVLAVITDYSEQARNMGIKFHMIKAGEFKGIGFGGIEIKEKDLEYLQGRVDKANNFFLSHVAESRKLSLSDKDKWGEARVFYAGEAKAVGLVDEVASIVDVMGGIVPASNKNREGNQMTYEEKLAQIAAGVAPETILTAEELILFQDSAGQEEEEGAPTETETEEEEGIEVEASDDFSKVAEMAMKVGEMKAEMKVLTEKLQASEAAQVQLKADADSLAVVARSAVAKLQVALSQPKVEKESAADIVAQYEELQAKLSAKFPNSRVSSTASDAVENKASIPNPLNPFGKV